jgi:hypothetical protein
MASVLKVDKLDPQGGTALEIGTSGDTISIPSGATLDISASTLTPPATMPASSGINLTALNATNLGSGTVPTARLGTGTASSSTVLYGDQTYKTEPGGGKILQVVWATTTGSAATSSSSFVSSATNDLVITTTELNSKLWVLMTWGTIEMTGTTCDGELVIRSSDDSYVGNLAWTRTFDKGTNKAWGTSVAALHDPEVAATTAITYKCYFSNAGSGTMTIGDYWDTTSLGSSSCTTTIMEVSTA